MRPPTVIGGGGAGAISTDMRTRARAEEEEQMRAAAAAAAPRPAPNLDLSAEAQFPGLGPNAAPAALMHRGWVGGAASRQVMNASFPTLGEATVSRGQKKKLKAKARRATPGTFGSTEDLPPAEVMAMGVEDAAPREAAGPSSVPPRRTPAAAARPSRAPLPAPAPADPPPGLTMSNGGSSRAAPPLQNAFEGLAVDEPAPGVAPAAAAAPARAAAVGRAQPDFPALAGGGPSARAGAAIGGWVSVGDKKAPPQPVAPKPPALNSKSSFPALQGNPGGAPGKPQGLAQAGNALFKRMQVCPALPDNALMCPA